MCLAIPCKITEVKDEIATVQVGDSDTFIQCSLMLLPEEPALGHYVLVHAGFAINTIEEEEAHKTLQLLKDMTALAGEAPLSNTAFDLS
jgi:hydrogenase expression/formation protein HypC